jgi:hypothetical protein
MKAVNKHKIESMLRRKFNEEVIRSASHHGYASGESLEIKSWRWIDSPSHGSQNAFEGYAGR